MKNAGNHGHAWRVPSVAPEPLILKFPLLQKRASATASQPVDMLSPCNFFFHRLREKGDVEKANKQMGTCPGTVTHKNITVRTPASRQEDGKTHGLWHSSPSTFGLIFSPVSRFKITKHSMKDCCTPCRVDIGRKYSNSACGTAKQVYLLGSRWNVHNATTQEVIFFLFSPAVVPVGSDGLYLF